MRRLSSLIRNTILILATLLVASEAFAWRETGHFVVCEIGYRHITPEARSAIDQITGGPNKFATQCTWPDIVRKSPEWKHSYDWHFINLNQGKVYFDASTINKKGDALQAILQATDKLTSDATSQPEKLNWLRFLGHFVGDIHQPLHVGHKHDLGGNRINPLWFGSKTFKSTEILLANSPDCNGTDESRHAYTDECVITKVTPNKKISLHKIWDLQMVTKYIEIATQEGRMNRVEGDSPYRHLAYSNAIDQRITAKDIRAWGLASPYDWLEESLSNRNRAYKMNDTFIKNGKRLGITYYKQNIAYLNKRLVQAGYRLAAKLNAIFARNDEDRLGQIYSSYRLKETKARIQQVTQ